MIELCEKPLNVINVTKSKLNKKLLFLNLNYINVNNKFRYGIFFTHLFQLNNGQNMKKLSSRIKQTGQGMTEYIIIVALIAVAAIAVYQFFGQTVRSQMSGIALEVSGKSAKTAIADAGTAADATTAETTKKGLSKYENDASR